MPEEELEEVRDPAGVLKENKRLQDERKAMEDRIKQLESELNDSKEELVSEYKQIALKMKALAELSKQGIKDGERVFELISLDGVDLDDKGNITGLEEKITEAKNKFPEIFDAKRRAARSSADIHATTPPAENKTGTEAQIARMFGKVAL